jgi:hypothetical protein
LAGGIDLAAFQNQPVGGEKHGCAEYAAKHQAQHTAVNSEHGIEEFFFFDLS